MDIKKTSFFQRRFVDPQGFEPRQTVPKTGVLPLHHGSPFYCDAKIQRFSLFARGVAIFFANFTMYFDAWQ